MSDLIDDFKESLVGVSGHYYSSSDSSDFFARAKAEHDWVMKRAKHSTSSFQSYTSGRISSRIERGTLTGELVHGLNFGSQDYLSLSTHPVLAETAARAAHEFGVHSAGSAVLAGDSVEARRLEKELGDFIEYGSVTLFPIGWAAGYGVITSLVRPDDHVILDILAHACLQEGANAATRNVHRVAHLSLSAIERRLKRIRSEAPKAGIMVCTETLFSMDSDVPDLQPLQEMCREYGARLVVDVAHDLGAIGPNGGGFLEMQNLKGKCDIIVGAFSKTFASIGGFVASNEPAIKTRLRTGCGPSTFTNAMTPLQIAILRKSLEIVRSSEGAERRRRLMSNVIRMRAGLERRQFRLLGEPSAIVPVLLGDSRQTRLATKYLTETGCFANVVEYPAVPKNKARWRLQVMADHTHDEVDEFVARAKEADDRARDDLTRLENESD